MNNLEDEFLDVLQNIEAAIISVYRAHPELADYQVDAAVEALGRTYVGESRGKAPTLPKSPLAQEVYRATKSTCDWRLGRENMIDETGQPLPAEETTQVEDVLTCLKRIRKSIAMWNKEAGSQGYLNYVSQFIL